MRATPISAGQLTCTSPDQPEGAGGRSVEVTMNGQQYSSSGVEYTYGVWAVVSSAWASRGEARTWATAAQLDALRV